MPSPKDKGRDAAPATGFEALDVKAEALEAQVAEIESEQMQSAQIEAAENESSVAEQVSEAIAPPPVVEAPPGLSPSAEIFTFSSPPRAAGVESLLTSALRCGQSAVQLQVEALGALGRARGPQDVLAVQMDFSRKLLDVYVSETRSAAASMSKLLTGRIAGAA